MLVAGIRGISCSIDCIACSTVRRFVGEATHWARTEPIAGRGDQDFLDQPMGRRWRERVWRRRGEAMDGWDYGTKAKSSWISTAMHPHRNCTVTAGPRECGRCDGPGLVSVRIVR